MELGNWVLFQQSRHCNHRSTNDVSLYTHVIVLTERNDDTFTEASDVLANITWLSALKSSLDHEDKVMFCKVDESLMKKADVLVNQLQYRFDNHIRTNISDEKKK